MGAFVYPEGGKLPAAVRDLARRIEEDGGTPLAIYQEPVGRSWHVFAMLPLAAVEATPFQRKPSESHLERLAKVIATLERFLDPIIAVPAAEGKYWTPNGNHRRLALARSRAKEIPAIVVPDVDVQYQILALNTEKAHNLREKCHEVIGMYRDLLARDPSRRENEFAFSFQEPHFITLGLVYEERGRFPGSAYAPILRRVDKFLRSGFTNAFEERTARARAVLAADDALGAIVEQLKARGVRHPYVKSFVLSRANPLTRARKNILPFDETLEKLTRALLRFDAGKVRLDQIAGASMYAAPETASE